MQDFRSLIVWQRAHAMTLRVYRESQTFPKHELFGLTSQLRRSCASIGANIAEGCGCGGREFARYLTISSGSARETEYHLILARDVDYLTEEQFRDFEASVWEVKRMLTSLIHRVRNPKTDD